MISRPLLLLLFFGSGAAALAYQVVWIRLLSLTLSITVYSLTTVLCAFMAGLALGSALSAAVADRIRRPLLAFGLVELGIAACGLVVPAVLFNLGPAYVWLHDTLGGHGLAFAAGRFLLASAVLLVPCTLMGFTLPVLSRVLISRKDIVGGEAGALYAANTLGAVLGCLLAGFALIPNLGIQATSLCAAGINIAVGGIALATGARLRLAPVSRPQTPRTPALPRTWIAAAAFALSGFTAMGYEVLWTRALEHFTHNSTYAYTAMLATFLSGIGIGSALAGRRTDRMKRRLLWIALVQLTIALTVIVSLRVYMGFETLVPTLANAIGGITSWPRVVLLLFMESMLTMLLTTLLLGAMFPLCARLAVGSLAAVGRDIGTIYVANTLGAIVGALLVGFWLLPRFGMRGAFVGLICTNAAAAAVLALGARRGRLGLPLAGVAAALIAVAILALPADLFEQLYRARFGTLRFYREEVTDTVMVTEAEDGSRMIRYADGRGTAGTPTVREDRSYAHIPLLLHADPKRVLQIGFGVGNTLSSTLMHPVQAVDCVELSPGVIDAAPYFRSTNRNALEDPRVNLVINDGRNFVLTNHDLYDVIRMDPPELHTAGVVNLYTQEFFESVRDHLAPGGIFSVWINAVMTPIDDIRLLLRTFTSVFPHVSVWTGPYQYSWVINASLEPHDPDLGRLRERFALPSVSQDLESFGIASPRDFLKLFLFTDEDLTRFAGDGPIVSDDHTRLDFSVPRSDDAYYGIANYNTDAWLVDLMEPGATDDVAARRFLLKIARLNRERRPVEPHLRGLDDPHDAPKPVVLPPEAAARSAREPGDES